MFWTVSASEDVLNYLLSLAEASRKHPRLRCGLSTRAVLAVRHAAQAAAAAEGRDHMIPDDIKSVFTAVCAHRFQVTDGLLTDREASEALAQELLDTVPVPKA